MLRYILFELGGLFENEPDREISEDGTLWMLESLTRWNQLWLKKHPNTPKLYDSGVVYKLPEQVGDDPNGFRAGEHFRDIPAILENGGGDCFPLSQKIIVRSRSTGMYELLALGELRHVYPAYEALSYNFSTCEQEFRSIVGFVDKGMKSVSKARLSNGTDLVATDDHKFWTLDGSGVNSRRLGVRTMGEYVEAMKLSRGMRTARSRILQAARIPALDAVHPSQAEAYLAGIYAAEGEHSDKKHTRIGQHKAWVREKIEVRLAEAGTSFHYSPGRGATPGSGAQYSLHRLGLLVTGRRAYAYKYEDHQGKGSAPIWRVHEYNDEAAKLRSRQEMVEDELPGLTYGTVRNAAPAGVAHVGCIEVEGNHNFFLADGTLVSNCDNVACWRVAELRNAGYEKVMPYITSRDNGAGGRTYHALVWWPDPKPKGSTEDPSLLLGMGGDERAAERAEEVRKNKERAEKHRDAIVLGVKMGIVSPRAVQMAARRRK